MRKFLTSIIIILLPLITWAQNNNLQRPNYPEGQEPEHRFAGEGGAPTPIDEYQYMLLGLAIVLMVYVYYTYKKRASTHE